MAQARRSSTEAVLAAAGEVFRRKGYQRATISDIAEAAGISRPTIYQYAPSKSWLLEQISQTVIDDMQRIADEIAARELPPLDRLRAVIDGHVRMSVKHRVFYSILLSEETEFSAEARRRMRAWSHERTGDIRRIFAELAEQGQLRSDVDITVAANLCNSSLNGLYRWYDESGPVGPEELTEQVLRMLGGLLLEPKLRHRRRSPRRSPRRSLSDRVEPLP